LIQHIRSGLPTLGICLGFQLLTQSSAEASGIEGLGLLPFRTERLQPSNTRLHKVPHLGWNSLLPSSETPALLAGIDLDQCLFFFANAYAIAPTPNSTQPHALYQHERPWLALVQHANLHGVQFHPEKSRRQGLQVLRNFLVS
jgi:imidazole glycerol phosphate synthase glutamine amidotransferase subunit